MTFSDHTIDNSSHKEKKEQFWKVCIDELKMQYHKKWISVTAYVYGLIKILRQDGWWLRFDLQIFAKEYGIPPSSLYRAILTLTTDLDLDFQCSAKEFKVRFGKAPISTDDHTSNTSASTDSPSTSSPQNELSFDKALISTDDHTSNTPASTDSSSTSSPQHGLIPSVRIDSHPRENFLIRENPFSSVRNSTPQTPIQQASSHSYRYLSTSQHTHT